MKKTGELLKKVREDKGLSLHEIGLSLKINAKILKQIEDGEKDNLPAKTFLRGFVQSYANYLKLDYIFIHCSFEIPISCSIEFSFISSKSDIIVIP